MKHSRLIFIGECIFFLCCTSSLKSQVRGCVVDGKDNAPLSGVNIYLQRDSTGVAITDDSGNFKLGDWEQWIPDDTLVFSYVGYKPMKYTLKGLEASDYRVRLYSYSQSLQEVVVKGEEVGRTFAEYEPLKNLPQGLYSSAVLAQDGKIYVVSGDESYAIYGRGIGVVRYYNLVKKMFVYDIARDAWKECRHPFNARICHAVHYYKNRLFILGGKYFSTNRRLEYTAPQLEVYDIDKDTVYVDKRIPHQAANPITFIYNDCLYVMGGTVKKNKYSDRVHMLDLKTGVWYDAGIKIPKEWKDNLKGVLAGHTVYLVGGNSADSMWTIRSFDLLSGEWKILCDLKEVVHNPEMALNGNLIYIYDGNVLQIYNITTNEVNACYFTYGIDKPGFCYADGKLYIIGAYREGLPSVEAVSVDVGGLNLK